MGGQALTVCTSLVVAGHGTVTDVLDVPTDTIDAQLTHLFETRHPTAAKVSIMNHPATVETVFRQMNEALDGPFVFDLTLSGPSGEDIISQRALDAVHEHLSIPDLVTLRVQDAELISGMEIPSLDDAQVAVQRVGQLGAEHVLLRCGRLPTHFFDVDSEPPDYAVDLFYDGDDFALYEAPYVVADGTHGASSALLIALLRALSLDVPLADALQAAKAYVTESLRHGREDASVNAPDYFWNRSEETVLPNP
jgi:hydroxymethylpyrimidine kinase/phosphomethylpyrimidine kinase